MSQEDRIQLLIADNLSRKEIEVMIAIRIEKMKNLIDKETALYIIAKERGLIKTMSQDETGYIYATQIRESPKAILIEDKYGDQTWLPKSVLINTTAIKNSAFTKFIVQAWICEKNEGKVDWNGNGDSKNIYKTINQINDDKTYIIKAKLTNISIARTYEGCTVCKKKAGNCNCGPEKNNSFVHTLIVPARIKDSTGNIKATFFGEIAEKLIGVSGNKMVEMKAQDTADAFLEKVVSDLATKEIIFKGKGKFSDFSNKHELNIGSFEIQQ